MRMHCLRNEAPNIYDVINTCKCQIKVVQDAREVIKKCNEANSE